MLNNKRQNYHHSKLPNIGDIIKVQIDNKNHPLATKKRFQNWIVTSFNLCDNVLTYSYGIHLVNLELLRDRNIKLTCSGFYCEIIE